MGYTEIVQDSVFGEQLERLLRQYPRVSEIWECADWQIGKDHDIFPVAFIHEGIPIHVWRSDESEESDIPGFPTFEIAYYFDLDDGCIHFLGIRTVVDEPII